jgi:hypothetical protein
MSAGISTIATKRYDKLKARVHRWMEDRFAVGAALREIRDEELYKHEYETFEAFCDKEYGFKKSRAYQLIEASGVKASLETSTNGGQIENERQARALAAVPEEKREEVLEAAAGTGKLTAKSITEAAEKVAPNPVPATKPEKVIHRDKTGYAIPDSIYPDWQRAETFQAIITDLHRVKLAVEKALDDADLAFREITNSTVADMKNAWGDLQRVLPYAVCPTCAGHNRAGCMTCKKRGYLSKFAYEHWIPEELRTLREAGLNK